jgi:hypothetical protein
VDRQNLSAAEIPLFRLAQYGPDRPVVKGLWRNGKTVPVDRPALRQKDCHEQKLTTRSLPIQEWAAGRTRGDIFYALQSDPSRTRPVLLLITQLYSVERNA